MSLATLHKKHRHAEHGTIEKQVMTKTGLFSGLIVATMMAVFTACSGIDISDEKAVIQDLQGTWIGHEQTGGFYRHIKLTISENNFSGWLQHSDAIDEPAWTVLPGESGMISLGSVQEKSDGSGKFRTISFSMPGRCCGDKSITGTVLSTLIIYEEDKGLSMAGKGSMARK